MRAGEAYAFTAQARVSVAVVGARKMAQLHKEYKKKEGATNVLSFSQEGGSRRSISFSAPEELPLELGDIVICYPIAIQEAARLGVVVDERIEQLALHAFENLMGSN